MPPVREVLDLPEYQNQYGNGFSSRGRSGIRRYEGDLPSYPSQYGSGGGKGRHKTVSFYSPRQGKTVTFKASKSKVHRRKFKRSVKRKNGGGKYSGYRKRL